VSTPGRQFTDAVTRFWTLAAPIYDFPFLQRWVYQPAQDEVVAELHSRGARRIADIACGTGILAARIQNELQPDEVYGVDMSDGMLEQARARSAVVQWRRGPAEQLPFADGSLDAVVTTPISTLWASSSTDIADPLPMVLDLRRITVEETPTVWCPWLSGQTRHASTVAAGPGAVR